MQMLNEHDQVLLVISVVDNEQGGQFSAYLWLALCSVAFSNALNDPSLSL